MALNDAPLVFATMFILFPAKWVTVPLISVYVRSLGLSIYETGVVAAALGAGLLVFEPMWGMLSDKGWKTRILIYSCLAHLLTFYLFSQVRDLPSLYEEPPLVVPLEGIVGYHQEI